MADRRAAERAGRRAEARAALLLRLKGYRVVACRYRVPQGEVDLIARRGRLHAFVEVKARATHDAAARAVTPRSWSRIARAAELFQARELGTLDAPVRFDLVTVADGWPRHRPDAWRP